MYTLALSIQTRSFGGSDGGGDVDGGGKTFHQYYTMST